MPRQQHFDARSVACICQGSKIVWYPYLLEIITEIQLVYIKKQQDQVTLKQS